MDIDTWFKSGCNYHQGVTLYASQKGHSPNLLRLFLTKQSILNANKLKYELNKYRKKVKTKIATPVLLENSEKGKQAFSIFPTKNEKVNIKNAVTNGFYKLNELHINLHPLAQKQRADFQKAISKHLQLTNLHPEEEGLALKLCIEIEDLFDAIETAQRVLEHYVKHKVVLNIESRNFEQLTAPQLLLSRNNKSTSVCKYKKKVARLRLQLKEDLKKLDRTKIEAALEKAESKLLCHEMELQELNKLINTPSTYIKNT